MWFTDISSISVAKDRITKLKDKQINLSIAVSLASGLAWKDKVLSFSEIIAKELLELFDENLLEDFSLDKFNANYIRINVEEKTIYFNRNNMFLNTYEQISLGEWLKQELVILENKELPLYLTSFEKEDLFKIMSEEEIQLVNRNYSRQELNSNKCMLNLIKEDETNLINLLTKTKYFSLSIYEYIKMMATGDYSLKTTNSDRAISYFNKVYNDYILELGAYIAKKLEIYIKQIQEN